MAIKFPKDFLYEDESYSLFSDPKLIIQKDHWYYPDKENTQISIIAGQGCYGDGNETFEFWDYAKTEEPRRYMNIVEIDKYLEENY